MLPILIFLSGLVLVLLGSREVIRNALVISRLTKIPPFIIGATVVAIGTSLPEIVVSFFGAVEKAPGLALGNIVGSNIANIGVILGISLLISPIYVGKEKTQRNMFLSLAVSIILFLSLIFDGLHPIHGIFFILIGFGVLLWEIIQGKNDGLTDEPLKYKAANPYKAVFLLIIGLACLFFGGKLLVDGGIELAKLIHIPEIIIGAVAVALGTSIPELAVSVAALRKDASKNEEKLVIGNILGSNIFNILFGAGVIGLFGISKFSSQITLYSFYFFTGVFCLLLFYFKGKYIPKWIGVLFLLSYVIYLLLLLNE